MTTEELAKLTPEEKRIRIAETQGWTGLWMHKGVPCGTHPAGTETQEPPDYLNDLNAMHEAEMTLRKPYDYILHLDRIAERENVSLIWHATAAQRADAFLLTVA